MSRAEVLDRATVEWMHQLGLVERLYPAFVEGVSEQLAAVRSALAVGEQAAALRLVHRLRGSAAQLGASALARVLAELEEALAQGAGGHELFAGAALCEVVAETSAALRAEVEAARADRLTRG